MSLLPKYVEQQQVDEVGGSLQLSSIFKASGRTYALLSDTETNKTILSGVPARLGEEFGLQLKAAEAVAGSPVNLDAGTRVEGYGVFTFPYGPVSFGVPEAGGFKLITYGERIVKVIPCVNFKKRGIERLLVGWRAEDALFVIERSAGNFSASYSTCFATAVENMLQLDVPSQAKWTRAVAIELERIYNHLYAFSRLAEAASQNVATSQVSALKEMVLRLNARYFGHRFLFGLNRIGGVAYSISREQGRELEKSIRTLTREFSEIVDYFLSSRIFLDRLQDTARLVKRDAQKLGAVGPVARGSDVPWDDRLMCPIEPYDDVYVNIETGVGEDTMARTMVRIQEIQSSTVVIRELLDKMPSDGATLSSQSGPKRKRYDSDDFSLCRIESPSGDLIQVVQLDEQSRVSNLHIRPASLVNWLPFAKSLENNVFTDFQFAFESFGLYYADSDR